MEEIAALVAESRLAQGFPIRVEDPGVLTRVAMLLLASGHASSAANLRSATGSVTVGGKP